MVMFNPNMNNNQVRQMLVANRGGDGAAQLQHALASQMDFNFRSGSVGDPNAQGGLRMMGAFGLTNQQYAAGMNNLTQAVAGLDGNPKVSDAEMRAMMSLMDKDNNGQTSFLEAVGSLQQFATMSIDQIRNALQQKMQSVSQPKQT